MPAIPDSLLLPSPSPAPPGCVGVVDAARLLGCHRATVLRLIRRGELTTIRPGRTRSSKLFIPVADLQRLLEPDGGAA
jgi:excisionase family DNA binding protein